MKVNIQNNWIDRMGMGTITIISLGYVLFGSSFAQLRFKPAFLDFPIFIGEILLVITSLFFIIKSIRQKRELGRWGWILGTYFFFVLFKAFSGYFAWGPLAFRDAALFYYPFFVVLGYSFWSNDLWGDNIRRLFFVIILFIFILHQFVPFWPCSLLILGIILALRAKNLQERVLLTGVIFLFAPYGELLNILFRTVFLSSMITVIFIGIIFFILFSKYRWVSIVGLVLGCLVLGTVFFKVSQTGMGSTFVIKNAKPLAATLSQEPSRGKYLFHPVGSSPEKPDTMKEFFHKMLKGCFLGKKNCAIEKKCAEENKSAQENKSTVQENSDIIEVKKSDTLFRYYIWRDMVREYVQYKPLFGFDFGRPLRSYTMKYYGISTTEYTDGWIGAHNSFLNMIYRAGIVGLVMVLSLLFIWFGLVRDFYILRDWTGVLLCAILLNWFISANFFLIFELPYTAIPVWTILGITLKHRMLLKNLPHPAVSGI